jgi:hypothetical protein
MDKQIRKAKKTIDKDLDRLAKADKKRDPYCEAGEKMAKKKKK